MTIKSISTRGNDWQGQKYNTQALDDSRPGVDGNVTPPPIPSTGEVPSYNPSASDNAIGEIMNRAGDPLPTPKVIAADGIAREIS